MKVLKIFLTVILSLAILFGAFVLVNQFNEKAMNEYNIKEKKPKKQKEAESNKEEEVKND